MAKLYIIRHGETDWNKEHKVQGKTDTPLNDIGKEQAKAIAKRLADEKIDIIFTSPLQRTIYTAEQIAKYHNLSPIKEEALIEINQGDWEGVKEEDLIKRKDFQEWLENIPNMSSPNGERILDCLNRLKEFFEKRYPKDKNVVLVTHGGTTRNIGRCLLKWSNEEVEKRHFANAAMHIIDMTDEPKLELYNYKKHLE